MSSDPIVVAKNAASSGVRVAENRQPKVSVVMPAFNVGNYISKSIRSVQVQTLSEIEIIVVDDCSQDHTREIIEQFAQEDSRVKVFFHPENKGVSAARNTALDNATGDWIAVVDPDDWIAPERFERLVEIVEAHGAEGVVDDQYFVNAETEETFGRLMINGERPIDHMTAVDFLMHDLPEIKGYGLLKPLFKRSFIEEHKLRYRTDFPRGQDCVFYCECLARGAHVMLTNEPYYYYRIHREGSTTANTVGLPGLLSIVEVQTALEEIFGTDDPDVTRALEQRSAFIQECLHYRRVVGPLKDKQYGKALAELIGEPGYAFKFARRLSGAAWRRLSGTND